jgi:hypothetical protein
MSGAIPPLPQYAFMAWCSVKGQGQFYLYLYLFNELNKFTQFIPFSQKSYKGQSMLVKQNVDHLLWRKCHYMIPDNNSW